MCRNAEYNPTSSNVIDEATLPLLHEEAVERLSECLYLKMERMEPNNNGSWENLGEREKDFYRASIREILLERTLLNLALAGSSDLPTIAR